MRRLVCVLVIVVRVTRRCDSRFGYMECGGSTPLWMFELARHLYQCGEAPSVGLQQLITKSRFESVDKNELKAASSRRTPRNQSHRSPYGHSPITRADNRIHWRYSVDLLIGSDAQECNMELNVHKLSKTYSNGVRALHDVTLSIPTGMFGLLGPNGAGKSTLMRTIATLQEADAGSVTLDGLDVLRDKSEVRKILGYLPQEFGLYPKV